MQLLLSLLLFGLVPPMQGPTSKDELVVAAMAAQQGKWMVLSFEHEGNAGGDDAVKAITREVSGERVVWKNKGERFSASTITVDPKAVPNALDVTPAGARGGDKVVLGIYKFEGDLLTICMAEPGLSRPKKFEATKGSHQTLITLRRAPRAPRR